MRHPFTPSPGMGVGPAPRSAFNTDRSRSGWSPVVDAVTLDLWYTLWYQRPHERADFRRRKLRVWSDCLRAAGASSAEVRTSSKALSLERRRHVVDGTAWSPRLAAAWLGKHVGIRVDVGALEFELDRVVAQIPVHRTPGSEQFVERMRRQGRRIGLVSNILEETPISIRRRLAEDGMMDWFDALAISSEVGWAKPDPRIFWDCLHHLRAPPRNSVHVGDLPVDIRGARAAHMKAVWFWGADHWSSRTDRSARRSARLNLPRIRTWTEVAHALAARRGVDG